MGSQRTVSNLWRATCGVDGSAWTAESDESPAPNGTFCPACKERGSIAPGILHWRASAAQEISTLVAAWSTAKRAWDRCSGDLKAHIDRGEDLYFAANNLIEALLPEKVAE